jgi:hypothetical protein
MSKIVSFACFCDWIKQNVKHIVLQVSITRKTKITCFKKKYDKFSTTHDHRQKNQNDDELIHENKSFNSIFVNDEIIKISCCVMRLFIINTHDDKKEWWQFRRSTTFSERLIDDAQKNKWAHKRRFLFLSRIFFFKLSIIFRMNRRRNDVKSSMNLIIIITKTVFILSLIRDKLVFLKKFE